MLSGKSSSRLSKTVRPILIPENKTENSHDNTNFSFLLKSMERDPTRLSFNQLKHKESTIVCSVTPNPLKKSSKYFFENVKYLNNSNVTMIESKGLASKENENSLNKHASIEFKGRRASLNDSPRFDTIRQDFSKKIEKYHSNGDNELSVNNRGQLNISSEDRLKSKMRQLLVEVDQLVRKVSATPQPSPISQSLQRTKLICSQILPFLASNFIHKAKESGLSEQLIDMISSLEGKNECLNELISQHEMANIKMFVKLNEGESQEMQLCKKQLASLFKKYKELEALIRKENKKYAVAIRESSALQKKYRKVSEENALLASNVKRMQAEMERRTEINGSSYFATTALKLQELDHSLRYAGKSITLHEQATSKDLQQKVEFMEKIITEQNSEMENAYAKIEEMLKEKDHQIQILKNQLKSTHKSQQQSQIKYQRRSEVKSQFRSQVKNKQENKQENKPQNKQQNKPQTSKKSSSKKPVKNGVHKCDLKGGIVQRLFSQGVSLDPYRILLTQAQALQDLMRSNRFR